MHATAIGKMKEYKNRFRKRAICIIIPLMLREDISKAEHRENEGRKHVKEDAQEFTFDSCELN